MTVHRQLYGIDRLNTSWVAHNIDRNMRITILTLMIVSFTLGCTATSVHTPTIVETKEFVTVETSYTPTIDWPMRRSTERVATVLALQTASATLLPTRPPTQTSTPKPTPTLNPASPLVSFTRYPNDGVDEITSCMQGLGTYRFVLYQDGRFILFDNGHYLATSISSSEIDKLLKRIEATGFFAVNGDGDQYISDAPTPSYSGGWGSSIAVKGHHVAIEDSQQDYLVSSVLETLKIIVEFKPKGLKAYQPDRVAVWSFSLQDTSLESHIPTPTPPILDWSSENVAVNQFRSGPYEVSGGILSFLLKEVGDIPAFRMVQQENQLYLILICPAFD